MLRLDCKRPLVMCKRKCDLVLQHYLRPELHERWVVALMRSSSSMSRSRAEAFVAVLARRVRTNDSSSATDSGWP